MWLVPSAMNVPTMRCPKCKRELALEHFQAKRTSKICKQCGDCRAKADVRCARHKNKDPVAYRAKQIAWLKTEKGKEYKQRESDQNTTEDGRAHSRALYAIQKETSRHKLKIKSPAFKKKRKERHAREWEKTKASPGNKLVQYIQVAICGCLDGRRTLSSKIEDNTEFKSTQEIMLHFSSQFEEGMTWGTAFAPRVEHRPPHCEEPLRLQHRRRPEAVLEVGKPLSAMGNWTDRKLRDVYKVSS